MRDFDPAGAERQRQRHHVCEAIDVGAMHHRVDRQRNLQAHDLGGKRALAREGAFIAGDAIGAGRLAVLDRDLHVIEAGVGQLAQRVGGDTDRRSNEVGVKAGSVRRGGDVDQIAPRTGLAAGEMDLKNTEAGGFRKHPRPGLRVEFVGPRIERQRVRAIRTAERAAVRQLGQETERTVQRWADEFTASYRTSFRKPPAAVRNP